MMQHSLKTVGTILMAVSFLLTGTPASHSTAAEQPKNEISDTKSPVTSPDSRKFLYDEQTKKTYGPKAPITWEQPTQVVFNHAVHTKDAGLTCESCHIELFTMKSGAILKSGEMTMAAMAEGKFCGTCHDGSTAFATNTKCAACHTDVSDFTPQEPIVWTKPIKAVTFDHKAHVEDFGQECDACHDDTFSMQKGAAEKADDFTMQALYEGKYCGKCHDGKTAFASDTRCNSCHIGLKGYDRMTGNDGAHTTGSKAGH